jgi:AcrR family transcriptional regulator
MVSAGAARAVRWCAAVSNVKNNSASQETRRRLLAAAGAVFADHGFHAATIKQITDRAGASLASVNYHFTDKAELYAAVLRRLAEESAPMVPPQDQLVGTPAERLRQFVRYFCRAIMGRRRAAWEQVLLARELAEPTAALDPLYEQVMRPLSTTMSALVADLLELPTTDPAVGLAAASVLGQCVYYIKQRTLLSRLHPQLGNAPDVDRVADYIAAFSLAGIRAGRPKVKRRRASTAATALQ